MINKIVWRRGLELHQAMLQIRDSSQNNLVNPNRINTLLKDLPVIPSPISTEIYHLIAQTSPIKLTNVIHKLESTLRKQDNKGVWEGRCNLSLEILRL